MKYLVEKDIPSIHATIVLPSGQAIRLFCLHPTPPVPQENPRSTEQDKEILLVGKLAKASRLPVIVAGDLNDVAWSYTTELFQKVSGLLDPGRGFSIRLTPNIPYCASRSTIFFVQRISNWCAFSVCRPLARIIFQCSPT